jgi:hypothetical protein
MKPLPLCLAIAYENAGYLTWNLWTPYRLWLCRIHTYNSIPSTVPTQRTCKPLTLKRHQHHLGLRLKYGIVIEDVSEIRGVSESNFRMDQNRRFYLSLRLLVMTLEICTGCIGTILDLLRATILSTAGKWYGVCDSCWEMLICDSTAFLGWCCVWFWQRYIVIVCCMEFLGTTRFRGQDSSPSEASNNVGPILTPNVLFFISIRGRRTRSTNWFQT